MPAFSTKWEDRLRRGVSYTGVLIAAYGLHWIWELRPIWPRSTYDAVPHPILEAIGTVIVGLYLVSKRRG
jgi:hypothetical protein